MCLDKCLDTKENLPAIFLWMQKEICWHVTNSFVFKNEISWPNCWNSIVRLSSYELVLTCVIMNYELKWEYMDTGTFNYSKVAKSILKQWLVTGPVSGYISVYIYIYIYIYTQWLASVMLQVSRVQYWVTACFIFCLPAGP